MDSQISGRHFAICTHPCCKSGVRSRILALEVRGTPRDPGFQPLPIECAWPGQGRVAVRVSVARAPRAVLRESEKLGLLKAGGGCLEPGEMLGVSGPRLEAAAPLSVLRTRSFLSLTPTMREGLDWEAPSRVAVSSARTSARSGDVPHLSPRAILPPHPPTHPLAPFSFPVRRTDGEG